jgi:membrane protease subunit (stomatin/prohibitin family)
MGLFNRNNRNGGIMDMIRCDEPSYLIWKWHPAGSQAGQNTRENAIRWGSSLRVKDGEVAVFVYKQENGVMQDFIEGPFDQTLDTENLPVLAGIIGLAYDKGTPFQAEVYFINLARTIQVRFGVPFFDVYDPRFADYGVPVAVRGTITFRISDYREFIKLNRLVSFDLNDFEKQIKDAVCRYVKDTVADVPSTYHIPVIQIESKVGVINEVVELDIAKRLAQNFGVSVSGVDIGAVEIDKTSTGYRQLMDITQQVTAATVQAQTAANIKDIQDKQRIEAKNLEETLRIQREEGQYAQRMQTRTSNMEAYRLEKQAQIGVAGAEALGNMGENGAGSIALGGGGTGFDPAAMMANMAVGSVVAQNIAGVMSGTMSGMNGTAAGAVAPPPVPGSAYYVALGGQPTGPFDPAVLKQMALSGQFTADTLVWKPGMEQWQKAGELDELKAVAGQLPPVIPN